MAFVTRKSRMAIVQETTEGTLKAPSAGTDYLAIQEGFSTELSPETLENTELKASLGTSQAITGFENFTASINHYLRHSGTEGQAPQDGYSNLLIAAYGAEDVEGTEYNTVAGSTTTVVNTDTGEGAFFSIGQALLVKHSSFAWEIAVVKSISGDALTLLFALQNAPATGTNLGKAVSYRAADSGHPSLSVHDFRGNEGAYAAGSGCRVTSMTIEATAGELINQSFELEGIASFWNPLEVTSSNFSLDFDDGGGEENASITQKVYKTPIELAAEIATKMNALTGDTITVTYSNTTGKFTIATDGVTLSLLWNTGTNTATTIGALIGFSTAADDTGATTYTSDNAQDLSSPQTPSFDSPGSPIVAKNQRVMVGDQDDNVCFSTNTLTYTLETPVTPELSICETSGKAGTIINERSVSVSLTANLPQYDADKFDKMINSGTVSFQYNFGTKDSSGNWDEGLSGVVHLKDATVLSHNLTDLDGLVGLELELQGYVDSSGNSETALNFV